MPSAVGSLRTWWVAFHIGGAFAVSGQTGDHHIRQEVLQRNVRDQTFVFGRWTEAGDTETHLTLLGEVSTLDGRLFKLMNSFHIWGYSRRGTSRLLVFNERDEYVGNYYADMPTDLPVQLDEGCLIFRKTPGDECDTGDTTRIDFTGHLPEHFFVECKGEFDFH